MPEITLAKPLAGTRAKTLLPGRLVPDSDMVPHSVSVPIQSNVVGSDDIGGDPMAFLEDAAAPPGEEDYDLDPMGFNNESPEIEGSARRLAKARSILAAVKSERAMDYEPARSSHPVKTEKQTFQASLVSSVSCIDSDSPSPPQKSKRMKLDIDVKDSLAAVFADTAKELSASLGDSVIQLDDED